MTEPARIAAPARSLESRADAQGQELLTAWLLATSEAFAVVGGDAIGMPVIAASESWARFCGLSLAEVVGHPCRTLLKVQSELDCEDLLRRVRDEGTLEHRLLDRPHRGRPCWSLLSIRAVGTGLLLVRRTPLAEAERGGEETRPTLDHYARAATGGSHGLWDWNLVTGEVWYSPGVKALLGYEPGEPFPDTFEGFHAHVVKEDAASVFAAVRRHLEQRHALDLECRVRTRSGAVRWFELRGTATRDKGGHPLRLAGSLLDISERRQSEETTRHAEGLQRSALDALPVAVGVLDAQGEIVETNRLWLAFESENALVGRQFPFGENYAALCEKRQQHCGQAVAAADGVRAVLDGRRDSFAVTYQLDAPEGERHYELRIQPFMQDESRGAIITHIDVSATRVAYARLAESRDFYELLLSSIPTQIAYLTQDRRVVYLNRSFEQWFGLPLTAVRGRRFDELLLPEDAESMRPHLDAVLHGRPADFEVTAARVDGELRDLDVHFLPHRDVTGSVAGFLAIVRDATEQKRLEATLRHAQKMEAIGQLTGGLAHDFNNLLSVIIGNLQLLERPLLARDEPLLKQVRTALRAALRGSDLTRRLLAFARQTVLEPRVVNVNSLVQGMNELLHRSLGREIEVQMQLEANPWSVRTDPAQLENCVLNLAINARDAMPRGGRLAIQTRNVVVDGDLARRHPQLRPGDYFVIDVIDNGTGMPPDIAKKAFEPFFTTKEVGKGTGLGLSMVYGFLEQSGGLATLRSEVGAGTTIRLYFPRVDALATVARELDLGADTPAPTGDETVLVVEDDSDVRGTAAGALRSLGYTVLEAGTAQQALEIIRSTPRLHLLFTDVTLPGGVHGPDLARRAQALMPELKVLFTSGFSESAIIHRGILDGTLPLIPKPYAIADLARRVRAAFRQG